MNLIRQRDYINTEDEPELKYARTDLPGTEESLHEARMRAFLTEQPVITVLDDIPIEILTAIFCYLPTDSMYNVSMTCTRFATAAQDSLTLSFTDESLRESLLDHQTWLLRRVLKSDVARNHDFAKVAYVMTAKLDSPDIDLFDQVLERSRSWSCCMLEIDERNFIDPKSAFASCAASNSSDGIVEYYLKKHNHRFTVDDCISMFQDYNYLAAKMFLAHERTQQEIESFYVEVDEETDILFKLYRFYGLFAKHLEADVHIHRNIYRAVQETNHEALRLLLKVITGPPEKSWINSLINYFRGFYCGTPTNIMDRCIDHLFESGYFPMTRSMFVEVLARGCVPLLLRFLDAEELGFNLADAANWRANDIYMPMLMYLTENKDQWVLKRLFGNKSYYTSEEYASSHILYAVKHASANQGTLQDMSFSIVYTGNPTYIALTRVFNDSAKE